MEYRWKTELDDGTRYLTFFGSGKHDAIYNRIRYLISFTYIFSSYFAKNIELTKVDSYDSLPIEKKLHNIIIHIKSVLNEDKNHYYYKRFSEKCSYQSAKN